jgi:single-strand DNA-binding protein
MLNHCTFIGNVGKDPEIRSTANSKVASLSIACTEKWKDKSGESKEKTEWVRCTVWGGLADVVEKYVRKGSKLYVAGRMETREYEKDGVKRYATEINVNTLKMLDSRPSEGQTEGQTHKGFDQAGNGPAASDMHDEIPF